MIHAEGERQATGADGGCRNTGNPAIGTTTRYLQTLTQVAGDKTSTVVFPVPVDLLTSLMGGGDGLSSSPGPTPGAGAGPAPHNAREAASADTTDVQATSTTGRLNPDADLL